MVRLTDIRVKLTLHNRYESRPTKRFDESYSMPIGLLINCFRNILRNQLVQRNITIVMIASQPQRFWFFFKKELYRFMTCKKKKKKNVVPALLRRTGTVNYVVVTVVPFGRKPGSAAHRNWDKLINTMRSNSSEKSFKTNLPVEIADITGYKNALIVAETRRDA